VKKVTFDRRSGESLEEWGIRLCEIDLTTLSAQEREAYRAAVSACRASLESATHPANNSEPRQVA
jgi:hypothetical protein